MTLLTSSTQAVGEEVVGRRLAEPGPYSMLEVLAPTMIDYAPAELAAEMVPRLLSGQEHAHWLELLGFQRFRRAA